MRTLPEILEARCVFCDYNGPNYWQAGSHKKYCPWHDIGGIQEREELLPVILINGWKHKLKMKHALEDIELVAETFPKLNSAIGAILSEIARKASNAIRHGG